MVSVQKSSLALEWLHFRAMFTHALQQSFYKPKLCLILQLLNECWLLLDQTTK
jgi:hypothetical protein